jgi:hypothetical protein
LRQTRAREEKAVRTSITLNWFVLLLVAVGGLACEGEVGVVEEEPELTADGDPEPEDGDTRSTYASLPVGATVHVCNVSSGVNIRTGPSTKYMVIVTLSKGTDAKTLARSRSWYKLEVGSKSGWAYGDYLCAGGDIDPKPPGGGFGVSRDGIINTAAAFVKFSYWWGGARLKAGSKEYGKCHSATTSGHSGPYGADCSGYVAKVWQLPEAMPFEENKHPFSTYSFKNQSNHWKSIARGDAKRADAMVYNSNGAGHIFIYESGNPWGQAWTYEARGCSYGIVHNLRTISSSYAARRRSGV